MRGLYRWIMYNGFRNSPSAELIDITCGTKASILLKITAVHFPNVYHQRRFYIIELLSQRFGVVKHSELI